MEDFKTKKREIKLLDLAVLLCHMHEAENNPNIGFLDTKETATSLGRYLNKSTHIYSHQIESMLWCSNLLNEEGKWWHPYHESFDEWIKDIVGSKATFNKIYNLIEDKE
jgi:hypothetical protein